MKPLTFIDENGDEKELIVGSDMGVPRRAPRGSPLGPGSTPGGAPRKEVPMFKLFVVADEGGRRVMGADGWLDLPCEPGSYLAFGYPRFAEVAAEGVEGGHARVGEVVAGKLRSASKPLPKP
jgi:hypothetical protein